MNKKDQILQQIKKGPKSAEEIKRDTGFPLNSIRYYIYLLRRDYVIDTRKGQYTLIGVKQSPPEQKPVRRYVVGSDRYLLTGPKQRESNSSDKPSHNGMLFIPQTKNIERAMNILNPKKLQELVSMVNRFNKAFGDLID